MSAACCERLKSYRHVGGLHTAIYQPGMLRGDGTKEHGWSRGLFTQLARVLLYFSSNIVRGVVHAGPADAIEDVVAMADGKDCGKSVEFGALRGPNT